MLAIGKVWEVLQCSVVSVLYSGDYSSSYLEHIQFFLEIEDGWRYPGWIFGQQNEEKFERALEILESMTLNAVECQRLWNLFGIPSSIDLDFRETLAGRRVHWSLRKYFE